MLFYDTDTVFQEVYPDCYKLLYLLMILSVSVACVDCFFFQTLRNQSIQTTLEFLLRIATESLKEGFSDSQ